MEAEGTTHREQDLEGLATIARLQAALGLPTGRNHVTGDADAYDSVVEARRRELSLGTMLPYMIAICLVGEARASWGLTEDGFVILAALISSGILTTGILTFVRQTSPRLRALRRAAGRRAGHAAAMPPRATLMMQSALEEIRPDRPWQRSSPAIAVHLSWTPAADGWQGTFDALADVTGTPHSPRPELVQMMANVADAHEDVVMHGDGALALRKGARSIAARSPMPRTRAKRILRTMNPEIALARAGHDRVAAALGMKPANRDDKGELWRFQAHDGDLCYVAAPDPTEGGRQRWLRVPLHTVTPSEGLASTLGISGEGYRPAAET